MRWKHLLLAAVTGAGVLVATAAPAHAATTGVPPATAYRNADNGLLYQFGPSTTPTMVGNGLGFAPGTTPAIALLTNGGRAYAFNAAVENTLWYVDSAGVGHDTHLRMASASSPAIAALPGGGYVIVFRYDVDGALYEMGPDGAPHMVANGLGAVPNSKPAVAAGPGGFEIAFHAATTDYLWYVDASNIGHDTGVKMAAGASPAITGLPNGYDIVFNRDSDKMLWELSPNGSLYYAAAGLGVATGTDPVVTAIPSGGFEIAFQAYGEGTLWTVDVNNVGHDTGLPMAPGTSPAIGTKPQGAVIMYQGGNHHLWQDTVDTGITMVSGESPVTTGDQGSPLITPQTPTLQTYPQQVTVNWIDPAADERAFAVQKRDSTGAWQTVHSEPTHTAGAIGTTYAWTDTDHSVVAQCYRVVVSNLLNSLTSGEKCTVRPDGSFPLTAPGSTAQWTGLSSVNDGTGTLFNKPENQNLYYTSKTLGVDLDFRSDPSLWKVEARGGGTQVLKGEPVALRVWGGGWLSTGSPFWGVGLDLDLNTPHYEWYVIGGGAAGDPLSSGTFALYNSVQHDFLVYGGQGPGVVNLYWYKDTDEGHGTTQPQNPTGVRSYRMYNCDTDQHSVDVWVNDLTAHTGFIEKSTLDPQYAAGSCVAPGSTPFTFSLTNGHAYQIVAVDKQLSGCGGVDDPNVGACRKLYSAFTADANGPVQTDTVDGGTQYTTS